MRNLVSIYLETLLELVQDRCTVCAKRSSEIILGSTRWYSYVMWLKRMLVLVCLEIVQILTQDRCTVSVEHTIGSEIVLDAPDGTPR
jgi:hypothetical protein